MPATEIAEYPFAVRAPANELHITPDVSQHSFLSTSKYADANYITILDGKCPYLSDRFLFNWQVLHDFVMDRMVIRLPFQYIAALLSLRYARVLKIMVIPYRRTPLHWLRYDKPTFMAYATFVFNKLKF